MNSTTNLKVSCQYLYDLTRGQGYQVQPLGYPCGQLIVITVGLLIDFCVARLCEREYPDPLVLHQKWVHHPPYTQDLLSKNKAMFDTIFSDILEFA